ncbi:CENPW protein, partial [Acrocephalus arundinaceus]|nr:CENPW protein [Acrocephalus arundinaceus]
SRRRMKSTAPRSTLRKIIKKHKPQLRLAANTDLLIISSDYVKLHSLLCYNTWLFYFTFKQECPVVVHLNFLLFLHRLAEEARTNAFENKSKIIKPEHTISAAKVL